MKMPNMGARQLNMQIGGPFLVVQKMTACNELTMELSKPCWWRLGQKSLSLQVARAGSRNGRETDQAR